MRQISFKQSSFIHIIFFTTIVILSHFIETIFQGHLKSETINYLYIILIYTGGIGLFVNLMLLIFTDKELINEITLKSHHLKTQDNKTFSFSEFYMVENSFKKKIDSFAAMPFTRQVKFISKNTQEEYNAYFFLKKPNIPCEKISEKKAILIHDINIEGLDNEIINRSHNYKKIKPENNIKELEMDFEYDHKDLDKR